MKGNNPIKMYHINIFLKLFMIEEGGGSLPKYGNYIYIKRGKGEAIRKNSRFDQVFGMGGFP